MNATAICLWRARSSNYFRWQLAHRLGRAASQLGEVPGDGLEPGSLSASIAQYLDAGLNHSFVDYSAPRFPFASPAAGPLGLAPEEVLRYLETHLMEVGHPDANSP